MNKNLIEEIKDSVNFHCNQSYKNLIHNLTNTELTAKQQKIIKESFDFLKLNIIADIDIKTKNQ